MLTEDIEEIYDTSDEESPTFGVVDDGRPYPAVTARRRQHKGSRRDTLYTVSKFGKYQALYDQFEREVITPYRERKRKRTTSGGDSRVNSANTPESGIGAKSSKRENGRSSIGFPVNSVDG